MTHQQIVELIAGPWHVDDCGCCIKTEPSEEFPQGHAVLTITVDWKLNEDEPEEKTQANTSVSQAICDQHNALYNGPVTPECESEIIK